MHKNNFGKRGTEKDEGVKPYAQILQTLLIWRKGHEVVKQNASHAEGLCSVPSIYRQKHQVVNYMKALYQDPGNLLPIRIAHTELDRPVT